MENLQELITIYLEYCKNQRQLDEKTVKAYRIDLGQFEQYVASQAADLSIVNLIENYISNLHRTYKPKTVKRKIASVKAFFHYLEFKDVIEVNPFHKIQIKFREPVILPKTIPLHTIEEFLTTMYWQKSAAKTLYQKNCVVRDIAVIELLFATGMRISELCNLRPESVDLIDRSILIYGKGAKERRLQIGNEDVLRAVKEYYFIFRDQIEMAGFFFVNRLGERLSEQSVRNMINKYTDLAAIKQHITPHMFRHSFATFLLEEDVDIRYIQEMLGHSSINITEIYTHVALGKQKDILTTKHPRKKMQV